MSSFPVLSATFSLTRYLASKRQLEGVTGTVTGLLNGVGGKRQLDAVQPVSESVASTLNGGTGIVGGAVGTAESTVGGVAGTAETAVSSGLGSMFFLFLGF